MDYNIQVDSGSLTEPLWDTATIPHPYPDNAAFVREYTIKLLSSSFPNMTTTEVTKLNQRIFFFRFLENRKLKKHNKTGDTICERTLRDEKRCW